MKLRLRSIESKETLKIEAPNPCTLRQLKQILSQNLPNSPSPASIRLSLNRKDELRSASPGGEDSLQILGVTAGDLLFFTFDSDSDLMQNYRPVSEQEVGVDSNSANVHRSQESEASRGLNVGDSLSEPRIPEFDGLKRKTLDTATQLKESTDCMELDDGCDYSCNNSDGCSADVVQSSFSVPGYLRKVFMNELNDDCGRDHNKLTVVAIHAVFSESGFVGFDRDSNKQIGSFQFKNDWPSGGFKPSMSYTLPDTVSRGDGIDSVVLKFHTLGRFMSVYGSLENESRGHGTHFLKLNEDQLVPLLNIAWANCGVSETVEGFNEGVSSTSLEKELFEFWRDVKDKLALPLLIGLCEKTGLELPPCFIRLPTDLKMKILELLPGVDVAKTSCVCLELRYLASSDDLWKLKFNEQFQDTRSEGYANWKKAFAMAWEREKARKAEERRIRAAAPRRIRHPNPFFVPRGLRVIGGPHDIWPVLGDDRLTRLHDPVNPRNFSPPCRLGGQNNRELI